ncbi:hypothetical protein AAMO2058_001487200 [Amorphochlora amoebiformis]
MSTSLSPSYAPSIAPSISLSPSTSFSPTTRIPTFTTFSPTAKPYFVTRQFGITALAGILGPFVLLVLLCLCVFCRKKKYNNGGEFWRNLNKIRLSRLLHERSWKNCNLATNWAFRRRSVWCAPCVLPQGDYLTALKRYITLAICLGAIIDLSVITFPILVTDPQDTVGAAKVCLLTVLLIIPLPFAIHALYWRRTPLGLRLDPVSPSRVPNSVCSKWISPIFGSIFSDIAHWGKKGKPSKWKGIWDIDSLRKKQSLGKGESNLMNTRKDGNHEKKSFPEPQSVRIAVGESGNQNEERKNQEYVGRDCFGLGPDENTLDTQQWTRLDYLATVIILIIFGGLIGILIVIQHRTDGLDYIWMVTVVLTCIVDIVFRLLSLGLTELLLLGPICCCLSPNTVEDDDDDSSSSSSNSIPPLANDSTTAPRNSLGQEERIFNPNHKPVELHEAYKNVVESRENKTVDESYSLKLNGDGMPKKSTPRSISTGVPPSKAIESKVEKSNHIAWFDTNNALGLEIEKDRVKGIRDSSQARMSKLKIGSRILEVNGYKVEDDDMAGEMIQEAMKTNSRISLAFQLPKTTSGHNSFHSKMEDSCPFAEGLPLSLTRTGSIQSHRSHTSHKSQSTHRSKKSNNTQKKTTPESACTTWRDPNATNITITESDSHKKKRKTHKKHKKFNKHMKKSTVYPVKDLGKSAQTTSSFDRGNMKKQDPSDYSASYANPLNPNHADDEYNSANDFQPDHRSQSPEFYRNDEAKNVTRKFGKPSHRKTSSSMSRAHRPKSRRKHRSKKLLSSPHSAGEVDNPTRRSNSFGGHRQQISTSRTHFRARKNNIISPRFVSEFTKAGGKKSTPRSTGEDADVKEERRTMGFDHGLYFYRNEIRPKDKNPKSNPIKFQMAFFDDPVMVRQRLRNAEAQLMVLDKYLERERQCARELKIMSASAVDIGRGTSRILKPKKPKAKYLGSMFSLAKSDTKILESAKGSRLKSATRVIDEKMKYFTNVDNLNEKKKKKKHKKHKKTIRDNPDGDDPTCTEGDSWKKKEKKKKKIIDGIDEGDTTCTEDEIRTKKKKKKKKIRDSADGGDTTCTEDEIPKELKEEISKEQKKPEKMMKLEEDKGNTSEWEGLKGDKKEKRITLKIGSSGFSRKENVEDKKINREKEMNGTTTDSKLNIPRNAPKSHPKVNQPKAIGLDKKAKVSDAKREDIPKKEEKMTEIVDKVLDAKRKDIPKKEEKINKTPVASPDKVSDAKREDIPKKEEEINKTPVASPDKVSDAKREDIPKKEEKINKTQNKVSDSKREDIPKKEEKINKTQDKVSDAKREDIPKKEEEMAKKLGDVSVAKREEEETTKTIGSVMTHQNAVSSESVARFGLRRSKKKGMLNRTMVGGTKSGNTTITEEDAHRKKKKKKKKKKEKKMLDRTMVGDTTDGGDTTLTEDESHRKKKKEKKEKKHKKDKRKHRRNEENQQSKAIESAPETS